MYKLGFTTLSSAQERLAYQGNGHEKMIDAVLCFVYMKDAYDVEQALHKMFERKALFYGGQHERMPMLGNGQSELYRDDVLGVDTGFTADQAEKTRVNVLAEEYRGYGASEEEVGQLIKNEEDRYRNSLSYKWRTEISASPATPTIGVKALGLIVRPILWVFFGVANLLFWFLLADERRSKGRLAVLLKKIEDAQLQMPVDRQKIIKKILAELAIDQSECELKTTTPSGRPGNGAV